MVEVPSVEALNHELPWEAEVFTHFQSFLIDVLCREVFSDATIVSIAELSPIVLIIEEVVNIHIVHIALDALQIDVLGFLLLHCC